MQSVRRMDFMPSVIVTYTVHGTVTTGYRYSGRK